MNVGAGIDRAKLLRKLWLLSRGGLIHPETGELSNDIDPLHQWTPQDRAGFGDDRKTTEAEAKDVRCSH